MRHSENIVETQPPEKPLVPPRAELVAGENSKSPAPKFGIQMQYKGDNRTIELPLSPDLVGRLAIEAEFRNLRIGELIAQLIVRVVEKDQFQIVLAPT
jgi:hypothetical protein